MEVHSRRFARQMEETFELDKINTRRLEPGEWKDRPLPAKLVERFLDDLRPVV